VRKYQEAFAKLDADYAGAILSFAALVGNYTDDRLASFTRRAAQRRNERRHPNQLAK
jgi:hypothetical protein